MNCKNKWIKTNACTHAHTFSLHHTCYPGVGVRRWKAVMWRHVLRPIGITLRRETGHLVSNANSIICSITSRNSSPWSCRDNTGWLTLLHFTVYMVYTAMYSSKCLEICMKTKCEAVSLTTCDGAACRQVICLSLTTASVEISTLSRNMTCSVSINVEYLTKNTTAMTGSKAKDV